LILSKKRKRLKFKQYCQNLRENGDESLSMMTMTDEIPTVANLMDSPLAKYITLAANDCGYSGTAEDLIVNYVHPLFLKAHTAAYPSIQDRYNDIELLKEIFTIFHSLDVLAPIL